MYKYIFSFLSFLVFLFVDTKAQILTPKFGGVAKYFKGTGNMFYRGYTTTNTVHATSATDFDTYFKAAVTTSQSLGVKKISGFKNSSNNDKNVLNWDNEADFNTINGTYTFSDNFLYKAEGIFIPKYTGTYTFTIEGDDAVDLFIGTTNVVNHYGPHGPGTVGTHTGTITLTAGKFYLFRIRLHEVGGGAAVKVFWRKPKETSGWYQDPDEIACISSINEASRWNSSAVWAGDVFNATLSYPSSTFYYHYTGWLDSPQGWSAGANNANQWIVYDLGSPQWILGIVTQGREDGSQWVTNAKIEYSTLNNTTSSDWITVFANATLNSDGTTKNIIEFPKRVYGRYVRVSPLVSGYYGHMTMRLGVIY
jgi:hypothetical protein